MVAGGDLRTLFDSELSVPFQGDKVVERDGKLRGNRDRFFGHAGIEFGFPSHGVEISSAWVFSGAGAGRPMPSILEPNSRMSKASHVESVTFGRYGNMRCAS